jgi:hypothetical protein
MRRRRCFFLGGLPVTGNTGRSRFRSGPIDRFGEYTGDRLQITRRACAEEQSPNAVQVNSMRSALLRPARLGQRGEDPAAILRARASFNETKPLEPGDDTSDPAAGEDGLMRDLSHSFLAPGPGEMQQNLELAEGQVGLGAEIGIHPPGDEGVGPQEPAPGRALRFL